jgi:hypothetical protein
MPCSSPRLDPRLVAAAIALDDPGESMAETWRRVGGVAESLDLTRPGYDSIREIVRAHRRRRTEMRRSLAPVVSDVLQGRVSPYDVQKLVEALTLAGRPQRGGDSEAL